MSGLQERSVRSALLQPLTAERIAAVISPITLARFWCKTDKRSDDECWPYMPARSTGPL